MSYKEKVLIPAIAAFAVTLATGAASWFTDGGILNWTGILTQSEPVIRTEFMEVKNLEGSTKFQCKESQFVVSCFVGLYPSGQQFCGSRIENNICIINDCGDATKAADNPKAFWGVTLGCQ
ncbi:hypothetical protein [Candidatus Albibeggiatoa sp. nov. NOAA]|uniref:hypothetical protein n=1 Tax=Candidatus Albibeggiatoa sp. nov. NOAA TaxID=3162724 RepID=UPI0032F5BE43|nr:hypothetical protein [Thiotrichaceae bacterium]